MKKLLLIPVVLLFLIGCSTAKVSDSEIRAAADKIDYGNFKSETLTEKAWEAFKDKNYPELIAYADKNVELHGEEGARMNAELTGFEPIGTASTKWALNDVGTTLWMKANAYVEMKMYPEATATYELMVRDYKYAQCWDPKGWFWHPAENAHLKAKEYKYLD